MKRHDLHSQEWRDCQPLPEPESTSKRFMVALSQAEERIKQKSGKSSSIDLKPRPR
jgi:hypothetical protein